MLINRKLAIAVLAGGVSMALAGTSYADIAMLPYQAVATGSHPEAVAIGDVTGDGKNDVVMTTSYYFDPDNDYKLFVFAQETSGALAAPVKYATNGGYSNAPMTVGIGDVNNDGRNDVVVGNKGTSIEVFLQDPTGALLPGRTVATPYSLKLRVGDLNGDGLMDVAGIGWGGTEVGVFLQDSGGSLSLSATYYAPHGGYDDLELGDVNNDGLTDIIVMSGQLYAYDNIAVLTQNGGGTFNPVAYYDLGGNELTKGVGVGDVTGDGKSDVVVSYGGNRPASNIAVFAQTAGGTLDAAMSMASADIPESLDVADLNGDGYPDLVVLHGGWYAAGVYEQNADGSLSAEALHPLPYASHYNPHGLAVGDINSDDAPDIVVADYNNGLVTLLNGSPQVPPPPANEAPVADAGPDRTVAQRRTVTLNGTASSDSDGTIVAYTWTQIAGTPVTIAATSTPGIVKFIAPRYERRSTNTLTFELVITDDDGATSTDQVSVVVRK
jgi:hypothetical protein